jgi:hypothetical protein
MSRPLRIQYPGAVNYVMALGNQGQKIFQDNCDRQCFLETLGETRSKTGWRRRSTGRKINQIKRKLARLKCSENA